MRRFAPSLLAFCGGLAWLLITTSLLPAGSSGASDACTGATMIGRLPEVPEASGLVLSRRHESVLWTHNDSGQPMLYAVGTDGRLRARVRVTGAEVDDWEDLAAGSCAAGSCLYIADIGDNNEARSRIAIYRIPEPDLIADASERATVFYATYPEGPQDAEGLLIDGNGTLFVVTKGEGSPVTVYRVPADPAPGGTVRLERIATLASKVDKRDRITGAETSADGRWVALRTLQSIRFFRADALLGGAPEAPIAASLSALDEPQGEGIAVAADGTVFLAGESGAGGGGGTLARVSCKLP